MFLKYLRHISVPLFRHLYILVEGQIRLLRLITGTFNLIQQIATSHTPKQRSLAVEVTRLPYQILDGRQLVPILFCSHFREECSTK